MIFRKALQFKNFWRLIIVAIFIVSGAVGIAPVLAADNTGTINATNRYVWTENAGWLDFGTTEGNVVVTDTGLTGYGWGENIGWISLSCSNDDSCGLVNYGVSNDGNGALSGYAWSENAGWINFSPINGGVTINSSGEFVGYAWGENIGWIVFGCVTTNSCSLINYKMITDWVPQGVRICTAWTYSSWGSCSGGQQTRTILSATPTGCHGGNAVLSQSCSSGGGVLPIYTKPPVVATTTVPIVTTTPPVVAQVTSSVPVKLPPIKVATPTGLPKKTWIESLPTALQLVIPGFLKPKPPETAGLQPVEELIPKQAPLALNGRWQLLSGKTIKEFVFAPLPQEFRTLAEKMPQLGNTFNSVGVNRMSDLSKLASVDLMLPGLTDVVGLGHSDLQTGKLSAFETITNPEIKAGLLAGIQSVPLASLGENLKDKIPSNILFAKSVTELIDLQAVLTLNDAGAPEQSIHTIAGKTILLSIKPDQGVKDVRGYVLFKSRETALQYQKTLGIKDPLKILAIDTSAPSQFEPQFGITPKDIAVAYEDAGSSGEQLAENQSQLGGLVKVAQATGVKPVSEGRVLGAVAGQGIEERYILERFAYSDLDGDGIYTATITAPVVEGQYDIVTIMDYEINGKIVSKEVIMKTVVDPEGYVYESVGDRQLRLPQAVVSIYRLGVSGGYELWRAGDYSQKNPQTTDVTGKYSFLVPPGKYYIGAKAPGYGDYTSEPFDATEGSGVHFNIELKPNGNFLKLLDWKVIVIVIIVIMLLYNFYRDWRRKKRE